MSISGWAAQKRPSKRGTKYFAVLTTATRNCPRVSPFIASMRCSKAAHSPIIVRIVSARSAPAAVRCRRLPICSYNGSPTDSLNSLSCIDTVGWVTWHALAAAVMLPRSANDKNRRN